MLLITFLTQCLHAQTGASTPSDNAASLAFENRFEQSVQPFLNAYCIDCHGKDDPEGMLNLAGFKSTRDVMAGFATWELIRQRVAAKEMPPKDADDRPSDRERQAFVDWIEQLRTDYAARHAGDPGDVLARRLSSAEYNYTIRDLTGVDIQPAREFPIDPANEAGFDNSGESLTMTPALLNKYLDAARTVADHLLFKPDGLDFAPHPVVTETDRDKYCVRRIIDFYQRQNTDIADYFFAAWRLAQQTDISARRIEEIAREHNLSGKYLTTIFGLFNAAEHVRGPIVTLRAMFASLPADEAGTRDGCRAMRDYVWRIREKLAFDFPHLRVRGINRGSQPLVLWRNRQLADHRMSLNQHALHEARLTPESDSKIGDPRPEELVLPVDAEDRAEAIAALEHFCRTFPDAFYVDRRGREYVEQKSKNPNEKDVRLLSAGFHSMMGYFRDDQPMYELLLTEAERKQLDQLWFELDFIANAPTRQHSGFIWFERAEGRFLVDAEFDAFRSEDKGVTSKLMIRKLSEAYITKAERAGANEVALQAMRDYFNNINVSIREVEAKWASAKEAHVAALADLAVRAYRRPLSDRERLETIAFYHQLVDVDGLTHEDAVRDVLVSVLMSPHFGYRLHTSDSDQPIHALSDFALASRLSYFLWSSMPDEQLLQLAAAGRLHELEILKQQASRMLRDPRARGLALEFAGNWLGFRQFESHNSVDRGRFTQFDDRLRQAMFEEPVRFTMDVIQHNRSVLDFLYADHTFANTPLATHYGIKPTDLNAEGWVRVDKASEYGRGGILPMAVFMTKNSPGLRTSPVKRGYWVVRQLLGEHIPPPPPNVPDLPNDESKLGNLTLREVLAKHRDHESCAGCHEKFDSVGLVFEGFGPIGERRRLDLSGNRVDVSADFPDGSIRKGVQGLRDYLRQHRQSDFVETLCRKLLSYALSRSLILPDDQLVDTMQQELRAHDYRFETLVHTIISSPQFVNQRGVAYQFQP